MYRVDNASLPARIREAGLHIDVYPAEELPAEYVDQLIQKSRQPHIQEFEGHEDTEGRFKDAENYYAWASGKRRIMYLLVADTASGVADIGGVIWFGERPQPLASDYDVTFAIRLYDEDEEKGWGSYLGKGLAVPFMEAAHADAAKHFPNKWLWLDYVKGNAAAERTYTKFGYEKLADEDGRVLMGNKAAFATREDSE